MLFILNTSKRFVSTLVNKGGRKDKIARKTEVSKIMTIKYIIRWENSCLIITC